MNPMTGPRPITGCGSRGRKVAEGLDDGEEQDGEAPEGEGVGEARDRPLQELPLAADLDELGLDPLGMSLSGRDGRLPGGDQPEEPDEAPTGDGEHRSTVMPSPTASLSGTVDPPRGD